MRKQSAEIIESVVYNANPEELLYLLRKVSSRKNSGFMEDVATSLMFGAQPYSEGPKIPEPEFKPFNFSPAAAVEKTKKVVPANIQVRPNTLPVKSTRFYPPVPVSRPVAGKSSVLKRILTAAKRNPKLAGLAAVAGVGTAAYGGYQALKPKKKWYEF